MSVRMEIATETEIISFRNARPTCILEQKERVAGRIEARGAAVATRSSRCESAKATWPPDRVIRLAPRPFRRRAGRRSTIPANFESRFAGVSFRFEGKTLSYL